MADRRATIAPHYLLLVGLVLLTIVILIGIYRASQVVPSFYEEALAVQSNIAVQAGDELEQNVVGITGDIEQGASWQLVLTDQQINGWLASDLQEKFPALLPSDVHEPRVAFKDRVAHVACRIAAANVSTVLSFKLDAYVTDRQNEVAVRVYEVRAGRLPVPLTKMLDQITSAARQSGLSMRWSHLDGDPVALIALPVEQPEARPGVVLDRLDVATGTSSSAARGLPK